MTTSGPFADLAKSVGNELRRIRLSQRLTQAMLAARLQAGGMASGSSSKTVSAWERGETPLPLPALAPLAAALRMEPGALAGRLGLCGNIAARELRIAEATDAVNQLADEPPEIADAILRWLHESVQIARTARLARTN